MSIDRSLKLKGALVRHRNVLTRAERLKRLKDEEKWEEGDSLFGLTKVANRKVAVVKKEPKKAVAAEGEAAIAGAAPAAGGAPAAGKAAAPAGKIAAPAKAAPAAKSTGQGKPGGGGGGRR
ncbi:MAG: small basic protein [Planctomycetes bacterium HGW-Planctomycetes-1]|nr:MAG: small basic protein [Planctomycetes bacterium HGW-Planctomycetes-1]